MDARLKDLMDWFATSGWRIVVIVLTKDWSRLVLDIDVAYGEDL